MKLNNIIKMKKIQLLQSICLALHFFSFMLVEALINQRAKELLGVHMVNTAYALGLLCTGLGLVSFSAIRRMLHKPQARKYSVVTASLLCIIFTYLFLTAKSIPVFCLTAMMGLLCFGHLGGCIYYCQTMIFENSEYMGRISGTALSVAIVLQTAVHTYVSESMLLLVGIAICIIMVLLFIFTEPKDWILENPLPYSTENKTDRKTAIILVLAVAVMSIILSVTDSVITFQDAAGTLEIYYEVRLFYALGLLVAGFCADCKSKAVFPITTVCFMLLSSVSVVLLSGGSAAYIGIALMYVSSGFYVVFFNVMLWEFAPKTKYPELWASMGRVVRSLTVSASVVPVLQLYAGLGIIGLTVVSSVFSVALFLILIPLIVPHFSAEVEKKDVAMPDATEQKIEFFALSHSFTPREIEVFEKLITTDDGVQEIADSLFISRRVLQRYIASIYEKTNTKSRIGLFQYYTKSTSV